MVDEELEIEQRIKSIAQNEVRIADVMRQLWNPDQITDLENLRQEELRLRQQNVILRREIADLRAKLPK